MIYALELKLVVFFFQAEDGIRDDLVTGVQTCALPIFTSAGDRRGKPRGPSTIASPFSPTAITLVRTGREGCRIRLPGRRALRTSLKYLASVTTWPRTRGPVILITWLWLLFCLVTSSASWTRHGPVGVLRRPCSMMKSYRTLSLLKSITSPIPNNSDMYASVSNVKSILLLAFCVKPHIIDI